MAAYSAHADTVSYTLDDVFMHNEYTGVGGYQMTGTFAWTYDSGDFENGTGEFSELTIPWLTASDYELLTINFDIGGSIEFNRDGTPSTHDEGIDITLFFVPGLTPTGSAQIDLDSSKFDIGGNGFIEGHFTSGSISPVPLNDADGDGVPDDEDNCPNDPNEDQLNTDGADDGGDACDDDDDNDDWFDVDDNCILVVNPTQCDGDGDNYGNHCDADFNNDLITNGLDIGPMKAAFGSTDAVTDLNCDGIVNGLDIGPLKAMFGTAPGPSGLVP